jgi:hypothetical protein
MTAIPHPIPDILEELAKSIEKHSCERGATYISDDGYP